MDDTISRTWLLAEYDKRHKGPPGGERKLIEEAPPVLGTNLAWVGTDCSEFPNNSDTISRQALLDKFEPWLKVKDYNDGELNMLKAILYEIRFMPPAQPKSGEWEITNLGAVGVFDSCSECKRVVKHKAPFYNFCPNCGADMRKTT